MGSVKTLHEGATAVSNPAEGIAEGGMVAGCTLAEDMVVADILVGGIVADCIAAEHFLVQRFVAENLPFPVLVLDSLSWIPHAHSHSAK